MENIVWDTIVIGGGPAGMMSAGRSSSLGAKVLLIEKNDKLGKKLLITGGGRCNVTNAEFDNRKLLEKFKDDGKFLFSAFSQYSVKDAIDFFHSKKMYTKIENEKRVFPITDKAESVWNVLVEYMKENKVTILSNTPVIDIATEGNGINKKIIGVRLKNNKIIKAKSVIVATGGVSRPETGSNGDAYKWLSNLGHKIINAEPSLVPISVKDKWIKKLAGTSLKNIKITTFQNKVKQEIRDRDTKILFTHNGLSGPTILNMSKDIGELLKYGEVIISLDLLPDLDYGELNNKLQEIFKENDKRKIKNSLNELIPSTMVSIIIELSKIDGDKKCNSISREERLELVKLLKDIPINVDRLLGIDKAIISSGGVSLDEVDFKTMKSRLFPNLFLIGDILNIDRPSGGYSLQICWTTGYIAGTNSVNI